MNKQDLIKLAVDFTETDPSNLVSKESAITEDLIGMRIYDSPIFAVASANDESFSFLKDPKIIGENFSLPKEWLPEAKSVISFFMPFTSRVRESNAQDMSYPSKEWLHGRIEGQAFIINLYKFLQAEITKQGYKAVVPCTDERLKIVRDIQGAMRAPQASSPTDTPTHFFCSNWSERHVAFACGLGTVGLSQGIITEKGMAGRLGSIITDLELTPSEKKYSDPYEYCTKCGICAQNCPAQAISIENGKDHVRCSLFIKKVLEENTPRYGCGKCQVNVPCEFSIP